jgi:uncharacterized membrane protein
MSKAKCIATVVLLVLAVFGLISASIAKDNIVNGIGGWFGWVFYSVFVFAIVVSANAVYNEIIRCKNEKEKEQSK